MVTNFVSATWASCAGSSSITRVASGPGKSARVVGSRFTFRLADKVGSYSQTPVITGVVRGATASGTIELRGICVDDETWTAKRGS